MQTGKPVESFQYVKLDCWGYSLKYLLQVLQEGVIISQLFCNPLLIITSVKMYFPSSSLVRKKNA